MADTRNWGRRGWGLAAAGLLAAPRAVMAQRQNPGRDQRVVVASKIDTEGALLGNLIVQALRGAGLTVEPRLALGPTRIVRGALLAGEVDLYPEYTGNGAYLFERLEDAAWRDGDQGAALVARLDLAANRLVWLDRARANNTWAIAVRRDVAQREGLATLEQFFAKAGRLRLAASAEFVESPVALPAFERAYGATFPRDRITILPGGDTAVTMRAAAQGLSGVNAAMVYGTDGAIQPLGLVVMQDNRQAQIVYEPAPVVRQAVLERFPAIRTALAPVFAGLTQEVLQRLNGQVAVEGRTPEAVARAHLGR